MQQDKIQQHQQKPKAPEIAEPEDIWISGFDSQLGVSEEPPPLQLTANQRQDLDEDGKKPNSLSPEQLQLIQSSGFGNAALSLQEPDQEKLATLLLQVRTSPDRRDLANGGQEIIATDGEYVLRLMHVRLPNGSTEMTWEFWKGSTPLLFTKQTEEPNRVANDGGDDLIVELPESSFSPIGFPGKGWFLEFQSNLALYHKSKPIGDENALAKDDNHLGFNRELTIRAEDGRVLQIFLKGRTKLKSTKGLQANLALTGESELRILIGTGPNKDSLKFVSDVVFGDAETGNLEDLIVQLAAKNQIAPILLGTGEPNATTMDAAIAKLDQVLPAQKTNKSVLRTSNGFESNSRPTTVGGQSGKGEGGLMDLSPSRDADSKDSNKVGGKLAKGADLRPVNWDKMSDQEKADAAWEAFKDEFSWLEVVQGAEELLAIMVSVEALGMAFPAALPAIVASLGAYLIEEGIMEVLGPYLEGQSPDVIDWVRGGLEVVLGAAIMVIAAGIAAFVGPEVSAAAGYVAVFAMIAMAIVSGLESYLSLEEARNAASEKEMRAKAKTSAKAAQRAIVEGIAVAPIGMKIKELFGQQESLPGMVEETPVEAKKAPKKKYVGKKDKPNLDKKEKWTEREKKEKGEAKEAPERAPGWVEIENVREKVLARAPHVLEIEGIITLPDGTRGFKGCHTKRALNDFVAENLGSSFDLQEVSGSPSEVYEAKPVIFDPSGIEFRKLNHGGKSSFFPDTWINSKIINEVVFAIENNHGRYFSGSTNQYFGFSSDGQVEIHFYLKSDGSFGSYFPKKTH